MAERVLSLGAVETIVAESFGQPGQRTFRVRGSVGSGSADLWMEKEQLVQLGTAIDELLEQSPSEAGTSPTADAPATALMGGVEAHVGTLVLGYAPGVDGFVLEARRLWDATLDVDRVRMVISRAQLEDLQRQVQEIIAAGRPRCLLCGAPLSGDAHFCPPSNGHDRVRAE